MKNQLEQVAHRLTVDNYKEMHEEVTRIFTVLESLSSMMDLKEEKPEIPAMPPLEPDIDLDAIPDFDALKTLENAPVVTYPQKSKTEEETAAVAELELPEKEYTEEDKKNGRVPLLFERRVKGGVVPEIAAFVPEKVVRNLDLQHGDKVYAKHEFTPHGAPTHYEYELAQRANPPQENDSIFEVNMGIVSYSPRDGGLVIERTIHSDRILHDGEAVVLPIQNDDLHMLDIKENDIVSAAFYRNNPETVRLRWKYPTEGITYEAPKKASFYKDNSSTEKAEVEQIFKGKKICVIGFEPGWASYKEEVEKRGGELLTLTGREPEATMRSTLFRSDAVVMILTHMSHKASIWTVDFCKQNAIPQDSMQSFGRTMFVETAADLI